VYTNSTNSTNSTTSFGNSTLQNSSTLSDSFDGVYPTYATSNSTTVATNSTVISSNSTDLHAAAELMFNGSVTNNTITAINAVIGNMTNNTNSTNGSTNSTVNNTSIPFNMTSTREANEEDATYFEKMVLSNSSKLNTGYVSPTNPNQSFIFNLVRV